LLQARHIDAGPGKQRCRAAVILIDQRQQQVLRLDELLVAADCQALASASACWNLVVNLSIRMAVSRRESVQYPKDEDNPSNFNSPPGGRIWRR
jgi:hypothetical protein